MEHTAIVIGGGIAGLAAAIGLTRIGWTPLVLEQAPRIDAVGAGISLWPNALQALDLLGVGDAVRGQAAHADLPTRLRTAAGRVVTRTDGLDMAILHRGDLHEALRAAVPAERIVTGVEAVTVTGEGEVRYRVGGRTEHRSADLVVGADGVHSTVRGALWPQAQPPRFRGKTVWRAVTPSGAVAIDAEGETWGRGGRFGMLQLSRDRVYWFAEANVDGLGVRYDDELAEVRERYGRWHEPIPAVLAATDPDAVLHHDILDLPPLPTFVTGRVALVGDAAHAMTPDLGQGACQALEDAVVLCAALADHDVPAALAHYDRARRPRTTKLARMSRRMGRLGQADGALGNALKLGLMQILPSALTERSIARVVAWEPPALHRATT